MAVAQRLFDQEQYAEVVNLLGPLVDEKTPASDLMYIVANARAFVMADVKDKNRAQELAKESLALYQRLTADTAFLKKRGAQLIYHAIGFCDGNGMKDEAEAFLKAGLAAFPSQAPLQLRAGRLCFQREEYEEGIGHLEKSLTINPGQKELADEVATYRQKPLFSDFRPSKPSDVLRRPLIHVRVDSGSPFPIALDSIAMKLDGKPVEHALGGNEVFYLPEGELDFGEHTVEIFARDHVGNFNSTRFMFPVDGSPPDAEVLEVRRGVRPIVTLKVFDKHSAVDLDTLSVAVRNATQNPNFHSMTFVLKGEYKQNDDALKINRGDLVKNPAKIVIRLKQGIPPGPYLLHVRAADVLGNSGEKKIPLTVPR